MYLEVKLEERIVENDVYRNFEKVYLNKDDGPTKENVRSGEVPRLVLRRSVLKRGVPAEPNVFLQADSFL